MPINKSISRLVNVKTHTYTYQSKILKLLIFYTAITILALHKFLTTKLGVMEVRSSVTYILKMLLAVTNIDENIIDNVRVFRRIICWPAIYR